MYQNRMIFPFFFVLLLSGACGTGTAEVSGEGEVSEGQAGTAEISFRSSRYDFGNVRHGEKLVYTFTYKNTGNVPLVIYSASADCGCTVPEFDKEPITPGKEGKIKIVFNTQGFMGYQVKTVQVMTNAGLNTLALRAMVE
jgi:hypothetical protein